MAFLLLCGFSLAACSNGDKKVSWERDKESITKSIQTLDEEQKKEAISTKALLAEINSRLQILEASSQGQQAQIEALSAQLEEQKRAEEQKRIEAQKRIEEQKRILEKKHADELKRIKAQKQKQLALQKARKAAAVATKTSESKQSVASAKPAATPPPAAAAKADPAAAAEAEKNAYTAAYLALKSGRFDEASKAFNEQLDLYPGGEYSDQAWYWLGETRYAQRAYGMASNAFKFVANNYPNSVKHAAALLKLGQISQALNRSNDAIKYYNRLINEHGDDSAAEQARAALARMQENPAEKQP
jgi:tol-pal system protein YbgF